MQAKAIRLPVEAEHGDDALGGVGIDPGVVHQGPVAVVRQPVHLACGCAHAGARRFQRDHGQLDRVGDGQPWRHRIGDGNTGVHRHHGGVEAISGSVCRRHTGALDRNVGCPVDDLDARSGSR